ncbi:MULTISPECIES: DUF397 domain-containing protein [Nocardia]|uniref:DUF397 domain-containing protein n=1 Tax=Nocardia nova TaxID=37330 RepID=A0A2T2YU75_9NOCA|nr:MULTISPECIES: DUF397 domain-containing protein [Nocardia]PSR59057.1 DUF397 domain-containing protein [Nocardia nova]
MSTEPSNPQWFKSSYSSGSQECVEVAFLGADSVGVRDSKCPGGPELVFSAAEWDSFTVAVRAGHL